MQPHRAAAMAKPSQMIVFGVPCRCADRAAAIRSAVSASVAGDVSAAPKAAAFVAATMAGDARLVAARALSAARARLGR